MELELILHDGIAYQKDMSAEHARHRLRADLHVSARIHTITADDLQTFIPSIAITFEDTREDGFIDEASARFQRLSAEWRQQRGPLSSITDMAMLPAYQEIIGMGTSALPFIFQSLKSEPDHWFWALRAITGENPVPEESSGNVKEMADAWQKWAIAHKYI